MAKTENLEVNADKVADEMQLDIAIPEMLNESASDEQIAQNIEQLKAVDAMAGLLSIVPVAASVFKLNNVAAVWTQQNCNNLSAALIPVLRKYPWGQKIIEFIETGAGVEELALMAILAPITIQTYAAYQADTKPLQKQVENEAAQNGEPSGN